MDKKSRKRGDKTVGPRTLRRLVSFEALFLVLALFAILVLRPPLRDNLAFLPDPATAVPAFVLLAAPGVALGGLLAGRAGLALRVALAVPLGVAAFGLPALAALALKTSFAAYLAAGRWVVTLSLVVLLYLALRKLITGRAPEQASGQVSGWWDLLLWVPFAGLTGVLAALSAVTFHEPNTDVWTYIRFVEEFSGSPALNASVEGFSRTTLGGWFLVQAALSEVSGVQPVTLTLSYLAPFLVVAAVLAFYGTARVLFENESAALFVGCLYALFLLVSLDGTIFSTGGEFVGRITEDKFVARFIFLPPALAAAVLFVRDKKLRYLALFGLLCAGVLSVHPVGLVIIGIPVAGFGLVHLALNLRSLRDWLAVFGLWASGLLVALPLAGYLLVTDSRFISRLSNTAPAVAEFRVRVWEYGDRLLALGDGSYIMHPALLLEPLVFAGYAVGVPFLVWKSWRTVAARLLLGTLLLTPAVVYIPPVSSFIGEVIGPWTLWRLAWPIPLAAALTVAWAAWEALAYVRRKLGEIRSSRFAVNPAKFAAALLPLSAVVLLAAATLPAVSTGVRAVDTPAEVPWGATTCSDPVFPFLAQELEASGGIMAQDRENSCIAAYSDGLQVLSYRDEALNVQAALGREEADSPQGRGVVERFFDSPLITRQKIGVLESRGVDYILLPVNSPLNPALGGLPGITALDNPGNRYNLFRVDRDELSVKPPTATRQAGLYLEQRTDGSRERPLPTSKSLEDACTRRTSTSAHRPSQRLPPATAPPASRHHLPKSPRLRPSLPKAPPLLPHRRRPHLCRRPRRRPEPPQRRRPALSAQRRPR